MVEKQCVLATASHLNRASVEEIEFDHSHISGGLSKIQTADNVIGIFTSRAMKELYLYASSQTDKSSVHFKLF